MGVKSLTRDGAGYARTKSVARFFSMKALPVKLPARPWLITIVTLKNRTLSPIITTEPMEVPMSSEADHTRRWLINAGGAAILSGTLPVTTSYAQTGAATAPDTAMVA